MKTKKTLLLFLVLFFCLFISSQVYACQTEDQYCGDDSGPDPAFPCCNPLTCTYIDTTQPMKCKPAAVTCSSVGGTCKTTCVSGTETEISGTGCGTQKCCKSTGVSATTSCEEQDGYVKDCPNCLCYPDPGVTHMPGGNTSIYQVLVNVIYWILGILAALTILVIIISGVQYIVSAGDERMVEAAKKNIKWAIIGLVVALCSLVIVRAISALLTMTGPTL
jgi:hypothetical protein